MADFAEFDEITIWQLLPRVPKDRQITDSIVGDVITSGNQLHNVADEMIANNPQGMYVFGGTVDGGGIHGFLDWNNISIPNDKERIAVGGTVQRCVHLGAYYVFTIEVASIPVEVAFLQRPLSDTDIQLLALKNKQFGDGPDMRLEEVHSSRTGRVYDWDRRKTSAVDSKKFQFMDQTGRHIVAGSGVQLDYAFCADSGFAEPYMYANQYYLIDNRLKRGYFLADAIYLWGKKGKK